MENLVTLSCPSCGGTLEVSPNRSVLICRHCGNSHLIKRNEGEIYLESYACCPLCGRNDRAEKVSAILRRSRQTIHTTHRITNDSPTPTSATSQNISTNQTAVSDLAKHLMPPNKPHKTQEPRPETLISDDRIFLFSTIYPSGVALFLILMFFYFFSSGIPSLSTSQFLYLIFFIEVAACGFLIHFFIQRSKDMKQENESIKYRNKQAIENWHAQKVNQRTEWEKAIQRWNKLYYCNRDDCVFVPNEETWAPISMMNTYLYQSPKEE